MFKGSCVALVSPMNSSGEVDENALLSLVEWHIQEGTTAIVIAGSTGEGATLSTIEQEKMFSQALHQANKRIPIIAGTGTNSTKTTIERTKAAQSLGVDASLVVTPFYNKPTQAGLIAHYSALAEATDLPIILYNVPSRTGCDMLPETVAVLSQIPSIIGIKEATGNLERLQTLKENCREGFAFYSGDDPSAFDFIRLGGDGVISITANVVPKLMQIMCDDALNHQIEKAQNINDKLALLHKTLCIESNPIPVKWVLEAMGKIKGHLRLPLTTLSSQHHQTLKAAMHQAGIV